MRLYGRTPGASLVAIAVLAIGAAFVGAFVSLYVDLALRPYPGIANDRRLVTIAQVNDAQSNSIPYAFTERLAEEATALDAVVGINLGFPYIPETGQRLLSEHVSQGFFDLLGPKLALGRGFERADHDQNAEPVVVISDSFWQEQFERRADILGDVVAIDSGIEGEELIEFRVVGVMAADMRGVLNDDVVLWVPMEQAFSFSGAVSAAERAEAYVYTIGRLRSGTSVRSLIREIDARYPNASSEFGLRAGFRISAVKGLVRDIRSHRAVQRQLQMFLAGSVLLAMVAAANVSLFLLARAPGRRRELAVRMAVGAPFRRLARQLATEAGLFVAIATVLGSFVSVWLADFLTGMAFLRDAGWEGVTLLDWRVLGLIGVVMAILTLLVSLAPVLGLRRLGVAASSRQAAARATPAQRIAGNLQIAVAGTLGGAALAFIWFLGSMTFGDPGYEFEDRQVVGLVGAPLPLVELVRQREILEALPGVQAVTLSSIFPSGGGALGTRLRDPADPSRDIAIGYGPIDGKFVDVLGLRLLYGRVPADGETGTALVNQTLARLVFGQDNVVGEFLEVDGEPGPRTEIVGVLQDLSFAHPTADVIPILFTVLPQRGFIRIVAESTLPAAELMQQLTGLYESGELELGQPNLVRPLGDFRRADLSEDTARGLLTIATATLVVLLAVFGFYGMQRYLVGAGRREYAIRASIGAGPRALGRLVLGRGLTIALPGLVSGALLAFILVAWLRDDYLSREISPGIVSGCVLISLALLLVAASVGPARRAGETQPAPLLRED